MKTSDLFIGTVSHIYAYSLNIVILTLMLLMSIILFQQHRRKKAYLSLTVSIFFIIAQYFLFILFESLDQLDSTLFTYIAQFLKVITFILLNTGIYQLYNTFRTKQYVLFNSSIGFAFLLSLLHFFAPKWFDQSTGQLHLMQDLGLELYLFVLIFLSFSIIAPRIGQNYKYQLGLTVFFIIQLTNMVNRYMYDQAQPLLAGLVNFLPVLYYGILFLILFQRVVELMQASYTNSITDGLTGLYNRRYFVNRLNQYIKNDIPVSLIFLDIDNFKKLNDTKGHQKGDEALRHVASILKESTEEFGLCGRYGGEEMVVMVTDPSITVGDLAEEIRQKSEKHAGVTVSIGYSVYRKGLTAETLLKQADEAMYNAKSTGKNKVVKYTKQTMINI